MILKEMLQSYLKNSAVLLVLGMLLMACDKQEVTPEASITLTNLEGDSYKDTEVSLSDTTGLFVKILAKKGVKNIEEFGHIRILNKTDTIFPLYSEKLVDKEREGFEKTWFARLPENTVKGSVVWEFYIIDEEGKKTTARLNMDVY